MDQPIMSADRTSPIVFNPPPQTTAAKVVGEMQERRREAIRTDPDGGAWEVGAVHNLRDILHLIDYAHLTTAQVAMVREARLYVDNYRDAGRRYEESNR